MSRQSQQSGFTLIEILVSMAVIAILASAMIPLATAALRGERIDEVEQELQDLALAAEEYYYENASFPASLTQVGFYGMFVLPGVQDEAITDAWGGNAYRWVLASNPDVLTIYSVGENGIDNGVGSESYKVVVQGSKPGAAKTRLRMRVIAAAVAEFVAGGGSLSGTWSADHASLGLATEYRTDGFGSDFQLHPTTLELRSAGADRAFTSGDDIVF